MDWYLIQTKPNAHLMASENLNRQGFKVFLPLIDRTSKRRGKFVNHTTPLFPGYLFMGTMTNRIPWKSINATRGVAKAITLDGRFRSINHDIIEGVKCRCDANGVLKKLNEIKSGDRARIEKGPFAEFICKVDEIADNKRAWVLINMLQQRVRLSVSINELSKTH